MRRFATKKKTDKGLTLKDVLVLDHFDQLVSPNEATGISSRFGLEYHSNSLVTGVFDRSVRAGAAHVNFPNSKGYDIREFNYSIDSTSDLALDLFIKSEGPQDIHEVEINLLQGYHSRSGVFLYYYREVNRFYVQLFDYTLGTSANNHVDGLNLQEWIHVAVQKSPVEDGGLCEIWINGEYHSQIMRNGGTTNYPIESIAIINKSQKHTVSVDELFITAKKRFDKDTFSIPDKPYTLDFLR